MPETTTAEDTVIVLGHDDVGVVAESHSMRYYLTDCCGASATGSGDGVACRSCYKPVDPALGGVPDRVVPGRPGRIVVELRNPLIEVYGDGLPYAQWATRTPSPVAGVTVAQYADIVRFAEQAAQ